jgi:large subunit ribosomal protein L24
MKTNKARKQRKRMYNAPQHLKRKQIASHLSSSLIEKYNVRAVPVKKGDTVRIMRGDEGIKGFEGKVAAVDTKAMKVMIEGVTMAKADGSEVSRKIHPSNVVITKLDLSDPWRRRKIESAKGD